MTLSTTTVLPNLAKFTATRTRAPSAAALVLTAVLFMFAISGCATNPVTGLSDLVLMSENQEIALGKQTHPQILEQYSIYQNPPLQALVDRLGKNLAATSHRDHLAFHFSLLDSPEVNAFALPGGYIYITRGIIAYMNSEEELAGVLGHEIGHVTARHGVRQHTAQTVTGLLGVLATVATGSREVSDASNILGNAFVRGYGRSHELEADRLGAEYLARTGYDPQLMLKVVGILKNQELFEVQRARDENRDPRNYHGVFSTHPRNDQRLQEVVAAADEFRNPQAKHTDTEKFLRILDGMTFGNSEEQGTIRGNRFYHLPLDVAITFPSDWRIDNRPTQLVAVRSDNSAAIVVEIDKQSGSEEPREYLQRIYPDLTDGKALQANSYTGITQAETSFGTGPMRVAATLKDKNIFVVSGFAKGTLPDRDIISTIQSIRRLQPSERDLAAAKRIKLVRAGKNDSFAKLAEKADLGRYGEEELRLLNDAYPHGEPTEGQLIKIIQ